MASVKKTATSNDSRAPDSTRLALAEQKIQLYEAILDRLDVGIHVIDTEEKTIVYNMTMSKLESENTKNMLGKKLLEAMPYLQIEDSTLITALRLGQPLNDRQQNYINAQGKSVATINSTTPLFLNGQLVGALEIAKDITFIQALANKIVDLQHNISAQNDKSTTNPNKAHYNFADIWGESPLLETVKKQAAQAAQSSSNILIYGETGTGKELFAQSIHNASPRKNHPFIAINCAALPEHLLEGLLFGTAKGGFTGAIDRPGFFEQAQGGTLLLDEINSMHLDLQAKLLRVLQEKLLRRVGATDDIPINVRIISTLNNNPFDAIKQNQLREDLYYRLGVVTLQAPPLCEHKEDIFLYLDKFIKKYNHTLGLSVTHVSPDILTAFQHYYWPGNVRELQHAIEGSMNLMSSETEIQMIHLPALFRSNLFKALDSQPAGNANKTDLATCRDGLEKNMIMSALTASRGNITHAAHTLGITRQLLQYKIRKYRLK